MAMKTVLFRVREGHPEPAEPVALVEGSEFEANVQVAETGTAKPKPGTIGSLLAIMESQPPIDSSLIDELNRSIEAGKLPARFGGVFDDERK